MKRRKFTNEFKCEAVKLVLEQGLSIAQAGRDLGIGETTLGKWIDREKKGILDPESLKSHELGELRRLRKENQQLRMEREILKKATAFFAKHGD
jgi:transposase